MCCVWGRSGLCTNGVGNLFKVVYTLCIIYAFLKFLNGRYFLSVAPLPGVSLVAFILWQL